MITLRFSAGSILAWSVVFLAGCLNRGLVAEQPVTSKLPGTQESAQSPDELAVREAGKAFAKAFNANDAKAIAAQWTNDGEFVDEFGERIVGREAIQKQYEKFFADYPGVQIMVQVGQVKMVSPTTAIVEGTTTLGAPDAKSPISSQYLAVRVKSNGKWMIASAHDIRTTIEEKTGNLADLEGLIGTWQYKTEQAYYETNCRWIVDKKFVERTFTVTENGKVTSSGTQIIGLDPLSKQITSWLFDSTGAHDVAVWTLLAKGWVVESSGVMADGTTTSAVNLLKTIDENSIAYKSINRRAGDESLPDSDEVMLKRVSKTASGR